MRILIAILALPLISGCVVKDAVDTAVGVATLPVRAGTKAVDLATTSEEEKDAKFLRDLRRKCDAWEKDAEDARDDGEPVPPPPSTACL